MFQKLCQKRASRDEPAAELNRLKTISEIGDWLVAIINNVRTQEEKVHKRYSESLKNAAMLESPSLSVDEIDKVLAPKYGWKSLAGKRRD
jgi:hypothetical protein